MVKIGPSSPNINTLDVIEEVTYADTCTETWQIIKFFLEELNPINSADLEPEDRRCSICAEDFTVDFHRAVKLPCNHQFGEPCIKKWLSPYMPWTPMAGEKYLKPVGANNCPNCRRVFFPKQTAVDTLPEIESRIKLWDRAYAYVGIPLSERERRARRDLLLYVNSYFARGLDEYYPSNRVRSGYTSWAYQRLYLVSIFLVIVKLTPEQEHLRRGLEDIAKRNYPARMTYGLNNRGGLTFQLKEDWETVQHDESHESHEEVEGEEESEELAGGDTEEMRFFRNMFR